MAKGNVVRVDADALEAEADAQLAEIAKQLKGDTPETAPQTEQTNQAGPETDTQQAATSSVAAAETEQTRVEPSYEDHLRKAEERVRNAQARMTRATQEAADLRRQLAEREAMIAELSRKPEDTESLKRVAEDYPDIAKPLLDKISELEQRLSQTGSEFQKSREDALREAHFSTIEKAHPDYVEVTSNDGFDRWLQTQSPVWQRIATQGTAEEVVELISRYKGTLKPTLQGTEKAAAAAEPRLPRTAPSVGSDKKIWSRAEIAALSYRDFERLEDEIDRAIAEGRVRP